MGVHAGAEVGVDRFEAGPHLVVFGHDHPGDHIGVAVDEFGHGVHDDIGTELDRALEHR